MIQCVAELARGLEIVDQEIRTRQLGAARQDLQAMRLVVGILDGALPGLLGAVQLCRCGRVQEPGSGACWRCGG